MVDAKTIFDKLPSLLKKYIKKPDNYQPKKNRKFIRLCFVLSAIFSCVVYYLDMAGDIFLLANYYNTNQMLYFGLTLAFILLQVIFVQVFMILFGINLILSTFCDSMYTRAKPTGARLFCRVITFILIDLMCLFQVHILFMYVGLIFLYVTYKEQDFEEIFFVLSKIILLFNLFEMYLESIPQFALQFYVFIDYFCPKTSSFNQTTVFNATTNLTSTVTTTNYNSMQSFILYKIFV